jgi:hypothetical protein
VYYTSMHAIDLFILKNMGAAIIDFRVCPPLVKCQNLMFSGFIDTLMYGFSSTGVTIYWISATNFDFPFYSNYYFHEFPHSFFINSYIPCHLVTFLKNMLIPYHTLNPNETHFKYSQICINGTEGNVKMFPLMSSLP